MRKYINIWSPDCPFEVSTTNRYTIVTQEAAATARRFIKKGETVKYLCGNLVAMTSEEEKDLDLTRRDFSIVMSSRKKTPSLFLGPARFANHDCNANARLVTRGSEGMEVVAIRNVEVEEEITVTYGDDYFGIGNCECLCKTCEMGGRNGWAKQGPSSSASGIATPSTIENHEPSGPYSFRNKRKYHFGDIASDLLDADADAPHTLSVERRKSGSSEVFSASHISDERIHNNRDSEMKTTSRASSLNNRDTPGNSAVGDLSEDESAQNPLSVFAEDGIKSRKLGEREEPVESIFDRTNTMLLVNHGKLSRSSLCPTIELSTPPRVINNAPQTPNRISQEELPNSHTSSDAESIFDRDLHRSSSPASTPCRNREGVRLSEDVDSKALDLTAEETPTVHCHDVQSSTRFITTENMTPQPDSESELSDLSTNEDFDDKNLTIIRLNKPNSNPKPKPKLKLKAAVKTRKALDPPSPTLETPKIRHPYDYTRTPLLLSEPFSRWVDCSTCSSCWVQPNGYYTRKECPRCERHSKLYGYRWPKTDTVKGEEVGRVMDHRTVHRFVKPEQEARIRKRGKGLGGDSATQVVDHTMTPAAESEPEEVVSQGRKSKRRRTAA